MKPPRCGLLENGRPPPFLPGTIKGCVVEEKKAESVDREETLFFGKIHRILDA